MKSYHFDIGNSTNGPIGFCARVRANSREEATQLLRDAICNIGSEHSVRDAMDGDLCDDPDDSIEYITVYFNEGYINVLDIDEFEELPDEGARL